MSCTTVDMRIYHKETFVGFKRCAINAMEHGVDLINYSVGGGTSFPNGGPSAPVIAKLVRESGIVFCSAAGNSGPSTSTTFSPGKQKKNKRLLLDHLFH